MSIVVGKTTFRDTVMDYNPIFRVVQKQARGVYRCVSEDNDGYGGVERFYSTAQIESRVRQAQLFADLDHSQKCFWARQPVGTILHYCDGFDKFVRGVVVELGGEKKLKPTALVGSWSARDLPRRRENGEIEYGYHAKKILFPDDDTCWQPSEGCVYENPESSYRTRGMDPRPLEVISLAVPEMTTEEKIHADKVKRLERITRVIQSRHETRAPIDEIIAAVRIVANEETD